MNQKKVYAIPALLGMAICFLCVVPVAASDDATASVGPTAVSFSLEGVNERVVLTVSGPGDVRFEKAFAAGSTPIFELFNQDGYTYPDGSYTWELRAAPTNATQTRDRDERSMEKHARSEALGSGSFTIANGAFVNPDLIEEVRTKNVDVPTKDQVILDDLIVDGSLCVGFDCVNGESFGFDTIRMKENNIRIKAQDTSTSASFPSNDWQLTFNDSSNGGANKFSIDDIDGGRTPFTIEAGARTNSLYVEIDGDVGFGTKDPVVNLHAVDGNTPTLRLEQDGSSGFTAQTWDLAGNEANLFIRDATNGSKLPFRIKPSAPTDSIFIAADGDVGFGTDSPQVELHVHAGSSDPANFRLTGDSTGFEMEDLNGPADQKVIQQVVNAGAWQLRGLNDTLTAQTIAGIYLNLGTGRVGLNNTSPTHPFVVGTDGTNGNGAHVTTGGVWTIGSSRAFKEGIFNLTAGEAFDALAGLNPVRFHYKLEPEEEYVGFIAEDVPDLVATSSKKYLSTMDIVAVLTKVVKEQQKTIDELSQRLSKVEGPAYE